MNILMMTNTYLPHVGGVARSVEVFTQEFRRLGHRVLVVAPQFEGAPADELDVVRVPAIQNFNGSDFSVRLPVPGLLSSAVEKFKPDIVHSHHPFLLGDAALRLAAQANVPLVFTHHTMYERYTHYVPGDSPAMREFAVRLAVAYCNLCDCVIAPSESIAAILRERGVDVPIEAIPTGVQTEKFAHGDGLSVRRRVGIRDDAFVVGHVGRLAEEKNLLFLARAVSVFLRRRRDARCILVGGGPAQKQIEAIFERYRVRHRVHLLGSLQGQALADAYHAMDLFAFASHSETQGLVLAEAMTAGVPVVAIDAPGAREVVEDRFNGRLLHHEHVGQFAEALAWVAALPRAEREALAQRSRKTAEAFSLPRCAERVLKVYERLIAAGIPARDEAEDDAWAQTMRLIEVEWDLWKTRAEAAAGVVTQPRRWLTRPRLPRPNPETFERWARKVRRAISRSEWMVRLFGLPRSGASIDRGLLLVQIDGLSRTQVEQALARRRMPFLRRLLTRQGYALETFYSGLPSTTPAVQAELFYGVKMAVPAFSFRDAQNGHVVRMYQRDAAERRQRELAQRGSGLLEGGSSYSNIYSGGARHAQLCAAALDFLPLIRQINPLLLLLVLVAYFPSVVRAAVLAVIEVILAVVDFFRGIIAGRDLLLEMLFIPRRVGVSALLREAITIGASVDVTRGVPIVHANFLGYDEQAHLRGPSSLFAHWTLKGIDRSIKRMYRAAKRSAWRDYDVWVFSDHGQEASVPYRVHTGRRIEEAVTEVLGEEGLAALTEAEVVAQAPSVRTGFWRAAAARAGRVGRSAAGEGGSVLTAMGPIGYLYLPHDPGAERRRRLAMALVQRARVPLVLGPAEEGKAHAWTAEGQFLLPDQAKQILGEGHPFMEIAGEELVSLVHHPDAGALVISGWSARGPRVSFVHECGAHGGPGGEETRAFVCVPRDAPVVSTDHGLLRPIDLRRGALRFLHGPPRPAWRSRAPAEAPAAASPAEIGAALTERPTPAETAAPEAAPLRVMTYNVHSCLGVDGKLSPHRIAKVIAQYEPDIVALQEVDVRRPRSGGDDQAHLIAHALEMEYHFHPAMRIEEEQYGNAVLSYLPLRLVRAGALPSGHEHRGDGSRREPRGALWVQVQVGQRWVNVFNTHLGLSFRERQAQVEALLGPDWVRHPECVGPVIVCGDFNALPNSTVCQLIRQRLRDAQLSVNGHRPLRTFWGRYPLGRIDHVFVDAQIKVVAVEVPRTDLACAASDHLPVVADLELARPAATESSAALPRSVAPAAHLSR